MIWGFKAADFDHETRTGFADNPVSAPFWIEPHSDNPVSRELGVAFGG